MANQVSSRSVSEEPLRGSHGEGLFYVLLYDTKYMARQREQASAEESINEADLEDTLRLNQEIRDAVEHHPLLDNASLRFFEDPYEFMQQVMRDHHRLTAVLNFCDDFSDRTQLWTMPALFELLDVPFLGYTTRSLHITHNKLYSHTVAKQLGIAVPETQHCTRSSVASLVFERFPALVKPVNQGGSEGITARSVVHDAAQLRQVAAEMTRDFDEVIVTDFLSGDEYSVCVVRQGDLILPLGIRQLQFKNFGETPPMYSFELKWELEALGSRQLISGPFAGDPAIGDQLIRDSVQLCHALGCKEFARVDWKCDQAGVPKFIEFNENPSCGRDSNFIWALETAEWNRGHLCTTLIDNLLREINYRMVPVGDFFVREDILDMRWACEDGCTAICCAEGCWFVREDRDRVAPHIPAIVEYLRDRPELPVWSVAPAQWDFCAPEPWREWTFGEQASRDWYHSSALNGRCVLQRPDGRCAVHSWCLDNNVPWETFKFDVCASWPLSFQQRNGVWELRLHREFYDREWDTVPCLRRGEHAAAADPKLPLMVESMASTIASRIGQPRCEQLLAVARQRQQMSARSPQSSAGGKSPRPRQSRPHTRRAR